MTTKAVVHVDQEDSSRLETALGNIENFLAEVPPEDSDLRMVIHSSAVKLLRRKGADAYASRIMELSRKGVRFLVCNNSLVRLKINRDELLEVSNVVPAGIVELIRLQNEGFAYVKP